LLINRIIALIINQDNQIHAKAIAAVEIPFLPLDAFLSSAHDKSTKNPQYNIYTNATNAKIHSNQLIITCINVVTYHNDVE
jgi:hypothetical protein